MSARASSGAGLLVLAATQCIPSLGPGDSLVTSTRILAIRADPAEAAPGSTVTFTALVAGPGGAVTGAPIAWDYCTAPKPITEDNVVSNACLGTSDLVPAGAGPASTSTTPSDGCTIFGPDVGSMGLRPRDPDATGGFYQPLRAELSGADTAFALARIHCDLPDAAASAATAFAADYHLNLNPQLLPLTATVDGKPAALTAIPAGARVELEASWPSSSAETYALFDASTQTISMQRESMQVAWYSTGGALDTESTGRASNDPATTTDDGWQAPGSAGTTALFVVLRDSRGGVDFATFELTTTP